MKKLGKILLIIIAITVLFVGAIFYFTRELPKEADAFLLLLREKRYLDAYSSTSSHYQKIVKFEEFENVMSELSYDEVIDVFWKKREIINGNQGKLYGLATMLNGNTFEIELSLLKENGDWEVSYINDPRTYSILNELESIPSDEDIIVLVESTLLLIIQDYYKNNYHDTYNSIAQLWKNQQTFESFDVQMKNSLKGVHNDSSLISREDPILTSKPKIIRENNYSKLHIQGQYSNESLIFDLFYIYEHPNWKLANIGLEWLKDSDNSSLNIQ